MTQSCCRQTRVYLCACELSCASICGQQARSGQKSHITMHRQWARSFQWAKRVLEFPERGWTSQGPPNYLLEEDSLLSLVEGQSGDASVLASQLPFKINPESGERKGRKMAPSHCLAACSTLMIPLVWAEPWDRGQDPSQEATALTLAVWGALSARKPSALS